MANVGIITLDPATQVATAAPSGFAEWMGRAVSCVKTGWNHVTDFVMAMLAKIRPVFQPVVDIVRAYPVASIAVGVIALVLIVGITVFCIYNKKSAAGGAGSGGGVPASQVGGGNIVPPVGATPPEEATVTVAMPLHT